MSLMKMSILLSSFALFAACEAVCGDNLVSVGEQCDDGNVVGGDGCESNCLLPNTCGNGVADAGELCFGSAITSDLLDATNIATGDFDGDGDIDVAATSFFGPRIAINNGTGALTQSNNLVAGANLDNPTAILADDIDGDGDTDVITSNRNDNSIGIFINNGAGIFDAGTSIASTPTPADVITADIDNDGDSDIINTLQFDEFLDLFLNNGDGTFGARQSIFISETVGGIALQNSDVDNDGDDDVVILDSLGTLRIVQELNGTFFAGQPFANGISVNGNFIMSDLTGDGFDEVVFGAGGNIESITNNGGLLNGLRTTFDIDAAFLASGDLDENGSNDVATIPLGDRGSVVVVANTGTGLLNVPLAQTLSLGLDQNQGFTLAAIDIALADMNGDGVLDVVASFKEGDVDFPLDGISVIPSTR